MTATTKSNTGIPLLLAVSSLGSVLAPLNSTMIAVALPEIRNEFSLSHAAVGWLISGYLIAMAVAQPLGGRLGDQIGRVPVFRAGLVAFIVLSIGSALAPNFPLLVAFRVSQAVAGAILIPNGMAMLRTEAPPEQLGRLNGLNGAVLSFAAAVGPLLGAAALAMGSWRLVFPLTLPPVVLALILLQRLDIRQESTAARSHVDWLGTALFVAFLAGITLQLSSVRQGYGGLVSVLRWAGLIIVCGAFIWRQRVTLAPAAEWRLFRRRVFAASTAYVLFTNLTMYTTLLMIPFFLRDVQGKSSQLSGLVLGAMSVLIAITAPVGGRLSDVWGRRPLAQAGGVVALAGTIALLAGLDREVSTTYLAGCLALLGLGLGLGIGPAATAAVEAAPRSLAGSASGTSSMMRYAGSILGVGVLAGVLRDSTTGDPSVAVFRLVTLAVLATAALAVLTTTFIHRFPSTASVATPVNLEVEAARPIPGA